MKTEDEQFDDLIRKKLDGSEVPPPSNLFNHIVPEEKKRRGFFWLWLAGIGVIITTALLVHQQSISHRQKPVEQENHSSLIVDENQNQTSKSENGFNENAVNEAEQSLKSTANDVLITEGTGKNSTIAKNNAQALTEEYDNTDDNTFTSLNLSKNSNNKGKSKEYAHKQHNGLNNINYDQLYYPTSGLSSNVNLIHPLVYFPNDEKPVRNVETTKKQITEFNNHLPGKWSFEAGAGVCFSKETISASTSDTAISRLINQMNNDLKPATGWQLHAGLIRQLNNHFSLSANIGFTQIKNSSTTTFNEYYKITEYDTISYPILFPFSPPLIFTDIDSTVISKSTVHVIHHQPALTSLSVGSSIHYSLPVNNFLIEPHAGIRFRVIQSVRGESALNSEYTLKAAEKYYKTGISPSVVAGLNLGYSVSEKVSAFFQPSYEYNIGNQAKKESDYQSKISYLSMGIGIRYTFFRNEAAEITPMLSDK